VSASHSQNETNLSQTGALRTHVVDMKVLQKCWIGKCVGRVLVITANNIVHAMFESQVLTLNR